uniref:Uncharacterized protein n=1 Tax=Cacopsylla melanoneura TaxID=428564 RepID=A0A8D9DXI1_9HEMI
MCSWLVLVTLVLYGLTLIDGKPWYFKVGEYEKEHLMPPNHNFTMRPPRYTGKNWMYLHGYMRGWNTSLYFTTVKVWFLKHTLPIMNFTLVQNTPVPTHSGERFENIKQLRRFTRPKESPRTFISYEYDTKMKIDYDAVSPDSWAVRQEKSLDKYLESDGGVYDSSMQKDPHYRDPKPEDFGTADYLTKIYTQRDPREEFGTLWDFPMEDDYDMNPTKPPYLTR